MHIKILPALKVVSAIALGVAMFAGPTERFLAGYADRDAAQSVQLAQIRKRMVHDLFTVLGAHAAEGDQQRPKRPTDIDEFINKFANLEQLIKEYGYARVVVHYKDKAPTIDAPGIGTRANYWFWKQVGWPTAAPPKRVGNSNFVRRDVSDTELKELTKDPKIDLVLPDIPMPPALSKSGPLVRPFLATMPPATARPTRQAYAVVVLDSGVDSDHPFLKGAMLHDFEACFSTEHLTEPYRAESLCPDGNLEVKGAGAGKPCPATIEHCDHGTHVAGIVAGWHGNFADETFSGVAPAVPVIAVQIYSKFNSETFCTKLGRKAPCIAAFISDQLAALDYVKELNAKGIPIGAVNMSLAMFLVPGSCDAHPVALGIAQRVGELREMKIPTVMAAGNDGVLNKVAVPACIEGAVTVAASDDDGRLAVNYPGEEGGTNFSDLIDVAAPGVGIVSSVPGMKFVEKNGTSMAAPHVAALLAKIRNERPGAAVDEQVQLLISRTSKFIQHPTTLLKRPIAYYADEIFAPPAVAFPASSSPSSTLAQPGLAAPGRPKGAALRFSQSNRLILDFGNADPVAAEKRIMDLLKQKGIAVVSMQNKTSRLSVIVTKTPIDAPILETLRNEARIKGLYLDVPLAPAK